MTEASDSAPEPEHAGCVVGTSVGLLVLIAAFVLLYVIDLGGEIDGEPELLSLFPDGEPPLGFVLDGAAEAPQMPPEKVRVLRLVPPEEGPEPPPGSPDEMIFVLYSSSKKLASAFHPPQRPSLGPPSPGSKNDPGGRMIEWEKDPSFAWHTTTKRDEIAWHKWRAAYAIERAMREGGSWRESARVNLDQNLGGGLERHLLLFAQWPENEHVDEDALRRILSGITMLESEEEG